MSRVLFFVFILAVFASGCVQSAMPEATATPALPSPASAEWKVITMTQSGGIMGLLRTVEVSSDGKYTVVDEHAQSNGSGELSEDDLAKLNGLISQAELISSNNDSSSVCADCFVYDLQIQSNDKDFAIQLIDISLPASGMEGVVGFLRGLMDVVLK